MIVRLLETATSYAGDERHPGWGERLSPTLRWDPSADQLRSPR